MARLRSAAARSIVEQSRDQLWNGRDLGAIDRFFAEDFKTSLYGSGSDREGFRSFSKAFLEAVPDLKFEALQLVAEDNMVAMRWSVSGSHAGPLFGAAPTGKRFEVCGYSIDEIHNNLIVRSWPLMDKHGLSKSLGTMLD